ncbi:MAG: hypothetical protein M3N16_00770 [Actinomycetota bacterium]|nr:hypothetical protein [Actinomycetota bacterium]
MAKPIISSVLNRRPRSCRRRLLPAAAVAVLALIASACGDDDRESVPELTVEQAVVREHNVGVARVPGTAVPATDRTFVLAGDRRSIFVLGPRQAVRRIDAGQEVTVTGSVERLTGPGATELADRVAEADPVKGLDRRLAPLLLRARRHQGSPYIRLHALAPKKR